MKAAPLAGALMVHGVGIAWVMKGSMHDPNPGQNQKSPASWTVVFPSPSKPDPAPVIPRHHPIVSSAKTTTLVHRPPLSQNRPSKDGAVIHSAPALPVLLVSPQPTYPVEAEKNAVTGVVVFDAVVHENGTIHRLTAIKSSGSPLLDQAALKAVKTWRFSTSPHKSHHTIPVHFRLNGG